MRHSGWRLHTQAARGKPPSTKDFNLKGLLPQSLLSSLGSQIAGIEVAHTLIDDYVHIDAHRPKFDQAATVWPNTEVSMWLSQDILKVCNSVALDRRPAADIFHRVTTISGTSSLNSRFQAQTSHPYQVTLFANCLQQERKKKEEGSMDGER